MNVRIVAGVGALCALAFFSGCAPRAIPMPTAAPARPQPAVPTSAPTPYPTPTALPTPVSLMLKPGLNDITETRKFLVKGLDGNPQLSVIEWSPRPGVVCWSTWTDRSHAAPSCVKT